MRQKVNIYKGNVSPDNVMACVSSNRSMFYFTSVHTKVRFVHTKVILDTRTPTYPPTHTHTQNKTEQNKQPQGSFRSGKTGKVRENQKAVSSH